MTKVTVGGGSNVNLRGTIRQGIIDIFEGANITIDKTNPLNPVISATGGGGGSGDVVGPASATSDNFALFDGTTGKLLKNSGLNAGSFLTGLINGNGTTVNGTGDGVDLGGTLTNNVFIDGNYGFNLGNTTPLVSTTISVDDRIEFNVNNANGSGYLGFIAGNPGDAGFHMEIGDSDYQHLFDVSNTGAILEQTDQISADVSTLYLHNTYSLLSFNSKRLKFETSGTTLNLGSDATGDTYYRNSSGYFTRLPAGTNGHVLTLASGIPSWAAPSGGGAWSLASGGTATGTNTFAMGTNPFILTSGVTTGTGATAGIQNVFNSLTTGNGLDISSSSVSSGAIVKITGTGTAAASNTQSGLVVDVSGANATSTQTTYGGYFNNTKTGTSSTNIAGYFNASGGTNNLAIYAPSGIVTLGSTGAGYNGRLYSTAGTGGRVALFGNLEITTSVGPGWSGTGLQVVGSNRKISFYGGNWSTDNDQVDVSWSSTGVNRSGVDLGIFRSSLGAFNTTLFQANSIAGFRFIDTWPTLTTPLNVVYGFDYSAGGAGNAVSEVAIRATRGQVVLGATGTSSANDRVKINGIGTTTGKGLVVNNSSGSERFSVQDDGVINVNGSGGTAGQVLVSNGTSAAAWAAPSGGGGITRSINSVSGTTSAGAAASTDYVYNCTSTFTLTLPTAVGNTNRYTIKNSGTGTITVNTTSSQTIDGSLTAVMSTQHSSIDVISNGTNWLLI